MRLLIHGTHQEWRIAEALTAWASLLYGVWLIVPGTTMDASIAPVYAVIVALGVPEEVWGLLFLAAGVFRLYAVLYKRHNLRRWAALLAIWQWGLFALGLFAASPMAALPTFCLLFSLASALSYLSALHCEVVDGRCNGTLEHKIAVMAASYDSWGEDT